MSLVSDLTGPASPLANLGAVADSGSSNTSRESRYTQTDAATVEVGVGTGTAGVNPGDDECKHKCKCEHEREQEFKDQLVPLYRFKRNGVTLLTVNKEQRGGYRMAEVAASVFGSPVPGTIPVYRYYDPEDYGKGHLYTTNPTVEKLDAYEFVGIEFYIDVKVRHFGEIPLFRFRYEDYHFDDGLHYFTVDFGVYCGGAKGYKFEGITGYVFSPTATATATDL